MSLPKRAPATTPSVKVHHCARCGRDVPIEQMEPCGLQRDEDDGSALLLATCTCGDTHSVSYLPAWLMRPYLGHVPTRLA